MDNAMEEDTDDYDYTMFLKNFSLVFLTLQNTLHILILRYTRTRGGDLFLSSTAVVLAEVTKCLGSLLILLVQEGSVAAWLNYLHRHIVLQPLDCAKIAIPAILYTLQNNLLYLALSNLDAATFQVYYQFKILTTAIFSVLLLRKVLTRIQWGALILLFLGISIVQVQSSSSKVDKSLSIEQNTTVGISAVVIACFLSGFAGVYFEKILKGSKESLWLRNVQLGLLGTIIGLLTMEITDGAKVRDNGFFFGYNYLVWIAIFLQSLGGLIVAVVVKYADNILKGFATSFAIIASSLLSVYFFNFDLTLPFCFGTSLVILSIYLYSKFSYKIDSTLPVIIVEKGHTRNL